MRGLRSAKFESNTSHRSFAPFLARQEIVFVAAYNINDQLFEAKSCCCSFLECVCALRTVYYFPTRSTATAESTAETLTVSNCNLHNKHPRVSLPPGSSRSPLLNFRPLPHRPYEYEHHYRRSASQPCYIQLTPSNPSSHFA